ncbi:MAG TPA: aminotransferase class V-fold PLP-dependent enzyme [Telluria sp.]|nr:aminotransferase class V-fold PLP-dependent enzyme [Telluria sp.]
MNTEIYLDANATSAVLPAAIAAAEDAMRERFGNPSSSHATGLKAKAMLDAARRRACRLLGVGPGRLLFTSGATEGIQTAVLSALCAVRARRARGEATGDLLLYGATEHKAVPETLAHWNRLLGAGLELRALPVDGGGRHRLDVLRELAPRAALVCTMAANNETGVVSDLAAIEAVLRETASPAYWMVDSVQALGKLALELAATRIDYAPFSGHKLYAPKGIGMLYVRAGAPYTALMAGGGQEDGLRSGTENMAGIAALGAVLAALEQGGVFRSHDQLVDLRARLAAALRQALPGIVFNAPFEHALPTTLNFSVPGLASKELLDLFDAAGVRVSAGSACSSAKALPSYVLEAMQLPAWRSSAAVRMSFGPAVDAAFIDAACARIVRCGEALRASCLIPSAPAPAHADGVVQLAADGACSWLVLDAASRSCVVIDPLPALAGRIAALLHCQDVRVRAVLCTDAGAHGADGRAALLAALGGRLEQAAGSDPLGWPAGSDTVSLGNGMRVDAIALGGQLLARLPQDDGVFASVSYLLGARGTAGLTAAEVRFAFTGRTVLPGGIGEGMPLGQLRNAVQRLAALVNCHTILCPAIDAQNLLCTTLATEGQGSGVLAELLALQPRLARPAMPPMDSLMHLEPAALARFLATHPDARLIDVRESYEHAAGGLPGWPGEVLSVPLSRLPQHLSGWLRGDHKPLVFFCRSGNRSARAAHCLHRLGYRNAWHVLGGVALAGPRALAA